MQHHTVTPLQERRLLCTHRTFQQHRHAFARHCQRFRIVHHRGSDAPQEQRCFENFSTQPSQVVLIMVTPLQERRLLCTHRTFQQHRHAFARHRQRFRIVHHQGSGAPQEQRCFENFSNQPSQVVLIISGSNKICSTTLGLPKISPGRPKVKPDSSSKRQENMSSLKSHKHLVSVAAGSSTLLEWSD